MHTLRDCAALLRTATSVERLEDLARAIGCGNECALLDAAACASLGISPGDERQDIRIARGHGSLRALLFETPRDAGRAELSRIAARLTSSAPHVLWVLLAVERDTHRVLLAAPALAARGVKVAALIVDRARVMDSDAETLRLLIAARSEDDLTTHSRFIEILGREAVSRQFFRKLESCVTRLADSATVASPAARREVALLYSSRLLFLAFLESKGWLDADAAFLTRVFDDCMRGGGGFHQNVLLPLFFGTLNTPVRQRAARARRFGAVPFLNGGLFSPNATERENRRLRFTDDACGRFFGDLLARYRFTSLEETASFEEAAVDPEMLGRTFECLMAPDSRRASGAFYTPHELVQRVTGCGLEAALIPVIGDAATAALMERGHVDQRATGITRRALAQVRILDPACGSGAFLVHALDRVASLRAAVGDARPSEVIRREVLARSIFGVDVNPTAVWLCQLRLWLSIVVDSREPTGATVPPLPNLDRNVRVGDSLAGSAFGTANPSGGAALRHLRERYARATGRRKSILARTLDREERRLLIASITGELRATSARRRDLVAVRRGRDLFGGRYQASREEAELARAMRTRSAALRRQLGAARRGDALPFSFPAHFADTASAGGFTLIVGNPPWVRPHHVAAHTRDELRDNFAVARTAPWASGAAAAGAGKGFAAQVDLAAVFVERSLRLLSSEGALSFLVPSKLWRSLSGGGLRSLLETEARVVRLEDYADVPAAFDAAVYPGLLVVSRDRGPIAGHVSVAVLHRSRLAAKWRSPMASLAWDSSPGAPWILMPPEVRDSFELLRDRGLPLSDSVFGRPRLGVKCGFNDAFLVRLRRGGGSQRLVVATNGREGLVESSMLRPVLRGEQVRPWTATESDDHIVWTHGIDGNPVPVLPEGARRWLAPHRRMLAGRADARRAMRWWSLFRTDAAATDRPRVVWADIGQSVRALVLPAGDRRVPLNTCYIARCPAEDDALALATILNSPLATAWLSVIAEPARGGYRRYLGWTMALFPLPARWDDVRGDLAAFARGAMAANGCLGSADSVDAVIKAYGVRWRQIEPLLAWAAP